MFSPSLRWSATYSSYPRHLLMMIVRTPWFVASCLRMTNVPMCPLYFSRFLQGIRSTSDSLIFMCQEVEEQDCNLDHAKKIGVLFTVTTNVCSSDSFPVFHSQDVCLCHSTVDQVAALMWTDLAFAAVREIQVCTMRKR